MITSLKENFSELGPISLLSYEGDNLLEVAHSLYDHYLGGVYLDEEHSEELTQVLRTFCKQRHSRQNLCSQGSIIRLYHTMAFGSVTHHKLAIVFVVREESLSFTVNL